MAVLLAHFLLLPTLLLGTKAKQFLGCVPDAAVQELQYAGEVLLGRVTALALALALDGLLGGQT